MSGEHGDGLARSSYNPKLFGPALYAALQEVKAAFDPANLMNPGKIVNAPSPADNLRYGPAYTTIELETVFNWESDGSYAQAIEMCNGAGVCRKLDIGTMCPSFMATKDERESTPRPRQRPAQRTGRAHPARGVVRARDLRDYAPVPGLQGVQDRMPLRRGHGEDQIRISGALLPCPRRAALQPHDGLAAGDRRVDVQAGALGLYAAGQLGAAHAGRQGRHVADRGTPAADHARVMPTSLSRSGSIAARPTIARSP